MGFSLARDLTGVDHCLGVIAEFTGEVARACSLTPELAQRVEEAATHTCRSLQLLNEAPPAAASQPAGGVERPAGRVGRPSTADPPQDSVRLSAAHSDGRLVLEILTSVVIAEAIRSGAASGERRLSLARIVLLVDELVVTRLPEGGTRVTLAWFT